MYCILILLLISINIHAFYTFFTKGDQDMVHIATQQKSYLSSYLVVLVILDISLLLGAYYSFKEKTTKRHKRKRKKK